MMLGLKVCWVIIHPLTLQIPFKLKNQPSAMLEAGAILALEMLVQKHTIDTQRIYRLTFKMKNQ